MTTQILNTLYVQSQQAYVRLEGDTLKVEVEKEKKLQVPLHHLGGIVVFGNVLLSPFLLARCAEDGRSVVWLSRSGRFVGRLAGPVTGNVLLRKVQHEAMADAKRTLAIAQRFVAGKVRGQQAVIARAAREGMGGGTLKDVGAQLSRLAHTATVAEDIEMVRGIEGQAAALYFEAFPMLISATGFDFGYRNRRPPRDAVNALLSFVYTLVRGECHGALESVGLDPQVGYLHVLRPGRPALALDLMEEFRAWWADRLALTLINRKQLLVEHFEPRPGGAVYLNEKGRRVVLVAYQKRKLETVRHRLFKEALPVGLLPFIQARLLARHLRGDLDAYPPFRAR